MPTPRTSAPPPDVARGAPKGPDQHTVVPQAAHPGRFPPAARVVHDVLGWLLAGSATLLAASGQVEYAIAADITDLRRFLVPAILEIAAIFLILGGYLRACDGDSPVLLWLLACGVTGFATWTNLTHGGPRAGRIFAAATVVTFVLWLLKLRDRYRAARRANGLIDAPTAKFRLIRWAVMPRLTGRAWLLAIEYNLRDSDEALCRARLWHDTARDVHAAATGKARDRRAAAHRAADLAVRLTHADETAVTTPVESPTTIEQTAPSLDIRSHESHPATNNPAAVSPTTAPANQASGTTFHTDVESEPPRQQRLPMRQGAVDDAGSSPSRLVVGEHHKDHGQPTSATTPSTTTMERSTSPARLTSVSASESTPPYKPTSDDDAVMYQTWRRGVATGQEPTGAALARAAGRSDDSTGVGRRAARRYRDALTTHGASTRPESPTSAQPMAQRHAAVTGASIATRTQ